MKSKIKLTNVSALSGILLILLSTYYLRHAHTKISHNSFGIFWLKTVFPQLLFTTIVTFIVALFIFVYTAMYLWLCTKEEKRLSLILMSIALFSLIPYIVMLLGIFGDGNFVFLRNESFLLFSVLPIATYIELLSGSLLVIISILSKFRVLEI